MTIAYQLYSSRNFGPLSELFERLAGIGYTAVEGYGDLFATRAEEIAGLLSANGLAMPSCHVGLDLVEGDPDRVIDTARKLGVSAVFVPFLMPDDRPRDAEGWRAFGQRLEQAGAPLRVAGLAYGWHNHDFEFRPLPDGTRPIEAMLEGTTFGLELDVAWVARAGEDPLPWLDRLASRLLAAHVKDIAPEGEKTDEDGWADPGEGVMDWPAIGARLSALGVDHWVVEHDNPSDDSRFARTALAFAKRLKGETR